jgi:hypothetical protein
MSGPFVAIGEVLRYVEKAKLDPTIETIDGLRNFHRLAALQSSKAALLERGISGIAAVRTSGADRRPAVLIRSSPHKRGREETPWDDVFDVDVGHIRYFGDNKPRQTASGWSVRIAADAPGNKLLSELATLHQSPDEADRLRAAPLLFFRAVPVPGRTKGQLEFQGYGVIDTIGMVTQFHPQSGRYFSNLVFDFVVLQLDDEARGFDWNWINLRRTSTVSDADGLVAAPMAWRTWVKEGAPSLERLRRRVSRFAVEERTTQLPPSGTPEGEILNRIIDFYSRPRDLRESEAERTTSLGGTVSATKTRFEALAEVVAEHVLQTPDRRYSPRWITRGTGDEGVDFVGRLRIGSGFSSVDVVVLGQAKCESQNSATGGVHIARTVARLQRGWLGIYVTTSHFSKQVQQEVIEDGYPIVLVPGLRVAAVVSALLHQRNMSLLELLREIDDRYNSRLSYRRPGEATVSDDF